MDKSEELQQFLEQEKQKAMISEMVGKLTNVCWDKCITGNPGSKFSSELIQTQYEDGFRDGYKDGAISGKGEGREVGLKHGFQVGEELGFYRGCVEAWKSGIRIDPNSFTSRVRKGIEQLSKLVEEYPLSRPENENVGEMMDAIRLKFRIVSANLGVKLEYEGQHSSANASKQDLEEI